MSKNTDKHLVIVGCGFTGTSALFQLVQRYPAARISVFEASGDFGPGYPYQTAECSDYLINNTTDTMCLTPSSKRAFVDWLGTRPDLVPDLDEKGHLPRKFFGLFLQDACARARRIATEKSIEVNFIPHEVTNILEAADGSVAVQWCEGALQADKVIVTTGRAPAVPFFDAIPKTAPAKYYADHVMSEDLDEIPMDTSIHILGASLSAYDVVNRLFAEHTGCRFSRDGTGQLRFHGGANQRQVKLCSRSGRLKAIESTHPMSLQRNYFCSEYLRSLAPAGGLTLKQVVLAVQREAEAHKTEVNWQAIKNPYDCCDSSRAVSERAIELLAQALQQVNDPHSTNFLVDLCAAAQVDLWDIFAEQRLSAEEEARYRAEFETTALSYMAPCPVSSAEKILALLRAGRLEIIKGVKEPQLNADSSEFKLEHEFGCEVARIIVDTRSKLNRDLHSEAQPQLVKNLVRSKLLKAYRRGGIEFKGAAVDMQTYRAAGSRSIYIANMMLWGPGIFTSSALMMARVVERIVDSLLLEIQ